MQGRRFDANADARTSLAKQCKCSASVNILITQKKVYAPIWTGDKAGHELQAWKAGNTDGDTGMNILPSRHRSGWTSLGSLPHS
uniref:Uncharacterized protein n=1 Tax=Physcomitrium patens TaxID=3218 RepID=A0A2K1LAS1_PHYPA|nr:hypothetical protein PHYPA_001559 [Physcomitrium patens]